MTKSLRAIWISDWVIFFLLLAGSFTIDANGRYPSVGQHASKAITIGLFSFGVICSLIMLGVLPKRKYLAVLLLVGYLALLFPALF